MSADDEPVTMDIPVWIHGSEKLVTGISRYTTCDDVIYSLLRNDGLRHAELESQHYVIYERWHRVERPLSGRSKLGKVWKKWGDERPNVKFFIKNIELPSATVQKLKRRHYRRHKTRDGSNFFDAERARAEKSRQQAIEEFVHLIGKQQQQLKEQVTRLHLTDHEIEHVETGVHLQRLREKGENYVQDCLFISDDSMSLDDSSSKLDASQLQLYANLCERIKEYETKITNLNFSAKSISDEIHARVGSVCDSNEISTIRQVQNALRIANLESERLNTDIDRTKIGISNSDTRIKTQTFRVEKLTSEGDSLDVSTTTFPPTEKENQSEAGLCYCVRTSRVTSVLPSASLDTEDIDFKVSDSIASTKRGTSSYGAGDTASTNSTKNKFISSSTQNSGLVVKSVIAVKKNSSKSIPDSDSNSDTGLSSWHSDETQIYLETLV